MLWGGRWSWNFSVGCVRCDVELDTNQCSVWWQSKSLRSGKRSQQFVCLFDKLASAYVHFEIRGTKTMWNARITAISVVQMICVLYLRYPETFWLYRNGLYVTMTVVNFEKSIFDINFQKKGKIHFSIEQYPQFFQKYVIVYHMIFVTDRISFDQFSKNKYNWPPSTPQFTLYFSSP